MQDSELIWKSLVRNYSNDHQSLYVYASGGITTQNIVINKILNDIRKIFCPSISEEYTKVVIKGFLDYKKKQHINGEINLKGIY